MQRDAGPRGILYIIWQQEDAGLLRWPRCELLRTQVPAWWYYNECWPRRQTIDGQLVTGEQKPPRQFVLDTFQVKIRPRQRDYRMYAPL
jgi:hypothetical protein